MSGPPPSPSPRSERRRTAQRRARRRAAIISLVVLIVIGGATAIALSSQSSPTASPPHQRVTATAPTTAAPSTTTTHAPAPGFVAGKITAIGDSVMIDYQEPLEQSLSGVTVDGTVSRQWSQGVDLVNQLKASGQLGATVIIGLSTNGPITAATFAPMAEALTGASKVIFVNIHVDREWQDPNNAVLAAGVASMKNAVLVDWNGLALEHPEWFGSDGTHLAINGPGAQALAQLIAAQAS